MMQEKIVSILFFLCAMACVVALGAICFFLFYNAIPTMIQIGAIDFVFGDEWYPEQEFFGIFPMIIGSICVSLLALVISMPIGILSALYLSYFCPKWLEYYAMMMIELLAAIPSVVYGFFALIVIVPMLADIFEGVPGKSLLAGALILSVMILPTLIVIAKASLCSVPRSYHEGALALGASKERSAVFVLMPAARSGIMAAIILAVAKALGEAMAVIMVAGNQVQIPTSLLDGIRTLSANIVLEMGYASGLYREVLIANAALLFLFVLLINIVFTLCFKRRIKNT